MTNNTRDKAKRDANSSQWHMAGTITPQPVLSFLLLPLQLPRNYPLGPSNRLNSFFQNDNS